MDIQNVNAMQDYELAVVSPGLVVGVSLDKENGRRLSITIRDNRLEKAEWIGDYRLRVAEEYFHGNVVAESDGTIVVNALPYMPCPYPLDINMDTKFWIHPEVKYWTPYASNSNPNVIAFANEITKHRLVFSKVKSRTSVAARIQEKEQKGYVLSKTSKIKDLLV